MDSFYRGQGMLDALQMLQQPPCVLATGDENGLSAEFPFDDQTSLLRALTYDPNPRLGNGLLMLLTLPVGGNDAGSAAGAATALALNAQELQAMNRSHFLGSWCPGPVGATFVSFFPNSMEQCGPGCTPTLVQGAVIRARWVTMAVCRRQWDYERARAARLQQLGLFE